MSDAKTMDRFGLGLTRCGETQTVQWKDVQSIFSAARTLGLRSGIVGWYHPYCHVFKDVADECLSFPFSRHKFEASLWKNLGHIFHDTFLTEENLEQIHSDTFSRILDAAKKMIVDPGLNLV